MSNPAIPSCLKLGGNAFPPGLCADSFAGNFHSKVVINSSKAKVNSSVYNGRCQLIVIDRNFMKIDDVKACLYDLSSEKCEGFDRIPVCAP